MSGIVRTSTYGSAGYNLAVSWSVQSQSVTNNNTTLSYRVFTDNNQYSSTWVKYYQTSVTINRTTVYSTASAFNGYKNQTLKTGTITIPHNADGTKSINVSLSADIFSSSGNRKTGSETITLPTINRGIYDVSLAAGWADLDGNKTVTFKKYNSNTTVKMWWQYWDNSTGEKTVMYTIRTPNGTILSENYSSGQTFAFQEDVVRAMHDDKPNYRTASVYITIKAYVGDSLIQTINRTIELKLKVEAPSLTITSKLTGLRQNLLGSSKRGLVGIHALEISSSVKAKNGANIAEVALTYDGRTYTNKTGNFKIYPNNIGKRSISVKAVDTRGYHYTVIDSVTILNYKKPYVTHRAYRYDGSKENPVGTFGRISGTVNIYDVKDASGKSVNKPYYTLSLDSRKRNSNNILYNISSLPISESRKYEITGEDRFSTSKTSGEIPTGQAPLVLSEAGIGVNVVPPENGRGLYVQDGLINGYPIANVLYLHASYNTHGTGNLPEAVKENWSKIPEGVSLANLVVGSEGAAIIHKYPGTNRDKYGSFICFGYDKTGGRVRRFVLKGGQWEEEDS